MTMPHLMNCPHSEDWCLACVKELHDEGEKSYNDYLKAMSVVNAVGEWKDGRITNRQLREVHAEWERNDG